MRIHRTFFRTLLFVVLVIFLAAIVINFTAGNIAKSWLPKKVEELSNGQYSLSLQDVDVSILQGDIFLKGVRLRSNPENKEGEPVIIFTTDGLQVQNFAWLHYLLSKMVKLEGLIIKNGALDLTLYEKNPDKSEGQSFQLEQLDLYPLLEGKIQKAALETLSLENLNVAIKIIHEADTLLFDSDQLNFRLNDILIDENQLFTAKRTLYSKSISFQGNSIKLESTGSDPFFADAGKLEFSSQEDKVSISLHTASFIFGKERLADTLYAGQTKLLAIENLSLEDLKEDSSASISAVIVQETSFLKKAEEDLLKETNKSSHSFKLQNFSLSSFLPSMLKRIKIDNISIDRLSASVENLFSLKDTQLEISDLFINEAAAFSNNRFLHAKSLEGAIGNFSTEGEEGKQQTVLSDFNISAKEGACSLNLGHLMVKLEQDKSMEKWMDLEASGISIDSLITNRISSGSLSLKSLVIEESELVIHLDTSSKRKGNSSISNSQAFELSQLNIYPEIREQFEQISLERLNINNLNLYLSSKNAQNNLLFSSSKINININDILIGEEGAFTPDRSLYAKQIDLLGYDVKLKQAGEKEWKSLAGNFELAFRGNMVGASAQNLDFTLAENSFQDTLMALAFKNLHLLGLDLHKLQEKKIAALNEISSDGLLIVQYEQKEKKNEEKRIENPPGQEKILSGFNLGKNLPPFIQQIAVNELYFNNLKLNDPYKPLSFTDAKVSAKNILVENKSAFSDKRFLYATDVASDVYDLNIFLKEPEQELKVEAMHFNMQHGKGNLLVRNAKSYSEEKDSVKLWFDGVVNAISIKGINTQSLNKSVLELGSVAIQKPETVIHLPSSSKTEGSSSGNRDLPDLYPLLKGSMDSLKVGKFEIQDGNFRFSGLGGSFYGLHVPIINVQVQDIVIAPGTAFLDDRILHASAYKASLKEIHYLFPDKVYLLQLDQLDLNTFQKELEINGFRYGFSENFRKKLEEEETNEVYRIENKYLKAENVAWQRLIREGAFYSDKVKGDGLNIYAYKDFNVPWEKKIKPMPPTIVREIGFPIFIKDIHLNNMEVIYEEMKKGAETAGLVDLTDMVVWISNFTNIEKELHQKPEMEITALGRLMGNGNFKTQIMVPLYDRSRKLKVTGTLDTLDATELNRMVRYNSRIAIKSGSFYKLNWDFEAGNEVASGIMEVSYENLKVQLSQPKSPDTTGVIKDVGSFFINALVVDSNIAEEKGKEPKPVLFENERNKERSFFHFYVQSLLAGLIEAIGVPFQ